MAGRDEPDVVVPLPASTVVLLRDRADAGVEVFLVQRHGRMGFMGGMHVFPGGKLSEEDCSDAMRARVTTRAPLADAWRDALDEHTAMGLAVAGIRETFEEAGVLLGGVPEELELAPLRQRLLEGEALARLLDEVGVSLELSELTPLSRWITPQLEPRRYDTRFYVARAPAEQRAEHDRLETVAGLWTSPQGALEKMATGDIRLAPPTERTLRSLLPHADVAAAIAWAAGRQPPSVEPILRVEEDQMVILYPGDPEHPDPEPAFEGPTRHVLRAAPKG